MKHFRTLSLALPLFVLWVSAPFLQAETVTYTIATKTSVTVEGTVPEGSTAAYTQTYSDMGKMTKDNSVTLTLTGYTDCIITGIVLNMHSNSSGGSGTFSATAGTTSLAAIATATKFSSWYGNTAYTDSYKGITVELTNSTYRIQEGEKVVIAIAATVNSLYIQSYTLTYSPSPITVTPTSYSWTGLVKGGEATAQEFTVEATDLTDAITATLTDETHFSLSAATLPATGGTLSVTPLTTTAGTHTTTLTLTSGSDTKTVPLSATVLDTYTVSFSIADGVGTQPAPKTVAEGESITLPEVGDIDCNGYTLKGWATAAVEDTQTLPTLWAAGSTYTPTKSATLYAVYVKQETALTETGTETITVNDFQASAVAATTTRIYTGKAVAVTWKTNGGTAFNASISEMRLYTKHTIEIKINDGYTFPAIVAQCTSTAYASALGGSLEGATKEVSSTTVTLTPTATKILITQDAASWVSSFTLSYTYIPATYTSTPTCAATPVLSVWGDAIAANRITFDATATGETATKTFTLLGSNLTDNVQLALTGDDAFAVSPTTITPKAATDGATVTLTYSPTTTGEHTATLALSATGADAITLSLSGTAVTPVTKHTITYRSCGEVFAEQQEEEGAVLSFPTTAPTADGMVFYGWSAAEVSKTDDSPAVLAADATVPTEDATYYAVFTQADYTKLTEEPADWAGEYLIVYESQTLKRFFNGALTDLDGAANYKEGIVIANNKIRATNVTDSITFTIAQYGDGSDNYYTLQSKSGYYIGRTAASNGITSNLTTPYPNTLTYTNEAVTIGSASSGKTDYQLTYNTSAARFRYYGSDTQSKQPVQLYAKSARYNYNTTGIAVQSVSGTETLTDLDAATTDLIVGDGATLTLEGTSSTVNSLTLQGDATVSVSGKLTLQTGLYLNAGWTTTDGQTQYATPRLYLNDDCEIDKTNDTIYLDFTINRDNYYPFSVPFATPVADIRYADPALAAIAQYGYGADYQYCIMTYNGEKRATGAVGDNWEVVGKDQTLQPGVGYIIKAVPGKGDTYAVIRVPMKVDNNWLLNGEQPTYGGVTRNTVSIEAYGADATDVADTHKGWNFIANPYLSDFNGSNLSGCNLTYVTVPVCNFAYYEQKKLSEVVLHPEWSFFVQTGEGGTLTFSEAGRQTVAPMLRAGQTRSVIEADICLTSLQSGATDKTGLLIGEQYSPAYEIGADLEKMFGTAFTVAAYTLTAATPLAYNALSMKDADTIPLGFHAPQAGDYTLSLPSGQEVAGVERIDLIDGQEGVVTNLLQNAYTFSVAAPCKDNARFALHIVAAQQTPTDIVEAAGNANKAHKVLRNGRLYIIQGNRVYDAFGQCIQ